MASGKNTLQLLLYTPPSAQKSNENLVHCLKIFTVDPYRNSAWDCRKKSKNVHTKNKNTIFPKECNCAPKIKNKKPTHSRLPSSTEFVSMKQRGG